MKEDIAKLLLEIKAVDLNTDEPFIWASGIKAPIYCDNRLLLSYPEKRDKIINNFLKLIEAKKLKFDIVAGVATAGIPWGAIIADRLKKPFVYVRAKAKDHGKENQIEGELEEGKNVLVVEDLISSGGSSLAAFNAIIQESCTISACIAIFNYNMEISAKNFTEAKIALYTLTDLNSLIKVALGIKYIDEKGKKALFEWQKNPKGWNVTK